MTAAMNNGVSICVRKTGVSWLLIVRLWRATRVASGRILKLLPRLLSVRRLTGRSVSSFWVDGCAFTCKETFQSAPTSSLVGTRYFRLAIACHHTFRGSGRANPGVPAYAQQHPVTFIWMSQSGSSNAWPKLKNAALGAGTSVRTIINYKKLASGNPKLSFFKHIFDEYKSNSSYGVFSYFQRKKKDQISTSLTRYFCEKTIERRRAKF